MKTAIISSVGEILRQLNRLEELGVNPNRLNKLRREAIFFLYEGGGDAKWALERPHSAKARLLRRQMESKVVSRNEGLRQLTYEHAVPLKTLAATLRAATKSDDDLEQFLDRHILGVVILRSEDDELRRLGLRQSMPPGSTKHDKLARYVAAGIEFETEDLAKIEAGWSIHRARP